MHRRWQRGYITSLLVLAQREYEAFLLSACGCTAETELGFRVLGFRETREREQQVAKGFRVRN